MRWKLCPQALKIKATLRRAGKTGWMSREGTARSLVRHVDSCQACGRDLEGETWPPR